MASLMSKKITIIGIITALVIAIYGAGALYALSQDGVSFKDFSAAFGPFVGLLVGYWIRGDKEVA